MAQKKSVEIHSQIASFLKKKEVKLHGIWLKRVGEGGLQNVYGSDGLKEFATEFIPPFLDSLSSSEESNLAEFSETRNQIVNFATSSFQKDISPREISNFFVLLRDSIIEVLSTEFPQENLIEAIFAIASVFDPIGFCIFESFVNVKERQINDQHRMLTETSVPVVKIWDRVIMVPLIGVLDSMRTQLMMETLLSGIEKVQAKVAILDISGIPIVDSLVARHLISTASGGKLMGTQIVITGISARISQIMVKLGVDLSGVVTRSTLADGLTYAFEVIGQRVGERNE
ncbi:MAG: STAS domain-containing protein [Candidatus Riflebacteria bacterium]|nr:STAS domain-containing protein [Candidatus Riflebacteria bacterium]